MHWIRDALDVRALRRGGEGEGGCCSGFTLRACHDCAAVLCCVVMFLLLLLRPLDAPLGASRSTGAGKGGAAGSAVARKSTR